MCTEILYRLLDIYEIIFRGRPRNSLRGLFIEKMKSAYSSAHDSNQILFNNAFQNFGLCWDM